MFVKIYYTEIGLINKKISTKKMWEMYVCIFALSCLELMWWEFRVYLWVYLRVFGVMCVVFEDMIGA